MPHYLDIDSWNRREHFLYFKDYDKPFFNVCVEVDVSELVRLTCGPELSFTVACLYLTLRAANETEPFRYRLRGDRVLVHDRIHGGTIVLLDDDTFTFCYFDYHQDFARFHAATRAAIDDTRARRPPLDPRDDRDDLIHNTSLPWIPFTSFSHARTHRPNDSIPKIAYGKRLQRGSTHHLPLSIEVHHALVDGLHVGHFLTRVETFLARPPFGRSEQPQGTSATQTPGTPENRKDAP